MIGPPSMRGTAALAAWLLAAPVASGAQTLASAAALAPYFAPARVTTQPAVPQAAAATSLTVADAIVLATREHPGPAEAAAAATAAAEAVPLARAQYLPRLDAVWQANRATRNNVFGLLLPQSVVPAISGPVLDDRSLDSVWGSAAGLLFSAEVYDFGRRAAGVAAARARVVTAEAQAEGARLDAGVHAADAFLTTLGAMRLVEASTANVTRLETLQRTVSALVDADLRPGADRSRVEAELASARNRRIGDEQAVAVARVRLAAATGNPDAIVALDAGRLLTHTPGGLQTSGAALVASGPAVTAVKPGVAGAIAAHPDERAATNAVQTAGAVREQLATAYRPTILLQGALSTRASGALVSGATEGGAAGLRPDVPNWAAGVTVTFPLLEARATHARVNAQQAQVTAAEAHARAVAQRTRAAVLEASIVADTAMRMADNTPVQIAAARQTDAQARARYDAGLTGITEVADAQRVLAQADADAALATLALWRARLAIAAASGDLSGFVAEAASPTGPPVSPSVVSPPQAPAGAASAASHPPGRHR